MKIIVICVVLLCAVGGAGGAYFMGYLDFSESDDAMADDHGDNGQMRPEKIFLPLDPPFVVNFTHRGTLRYLQVSLELMYSDQAVIDQINDEMPAIRNALILLFSDQDYESLSTFQGKEDLREAILLAVNDVIGLNTSDDNQPGEAYFTNFVMQ